MIFVYESCGSMMLLKCENKRTVSCLSTIQKLGCVEVTRRGKNVVIPNVLNDYNLRIGRIDKCYQMLSAFPIEIKRIEVFYKKQFRHLINMCIFNPHCMCINDCI